MEIYNLECSSDGEFWYVMFSDYDIYHINKLYKFTMKRFPILHLRITKIIKKTK